MAVSNKELRSATTPAKGVFESSPEDITTPIILQLIQKSMAEFDVTVIPAQDTRGAGRVTAKVCTLTTDQMGEVETLAAQSITSGYTMDAYQRALKKYKLSRMVQKITLGEGTVLDFSTMPDGETQAFHYFGLINEVLFDTYYRTCVTDILHRVSQAILAARGLESFF